MINFELICFQRIFSRLDIAQAGLGSVLAARRFDKFLADRRLSHSDNMPLLPDNMGLLRNKGMLLYEGCPFAAMQPLIS